MLKGLNVKEKVFIKLSNCLHKLESHYQRRTAFLLNKEEDSNLFEYINLSIQNELLEIKCLSEILGLNLDPYVEFMKETYKA